MESVVRGCFLINVPSGDGPLRCQPWLQLTEHGIGIVRITLIFRVIIPAEISQAAAKNVPHTRQQPRPTGAQIGSETIAFRPVPILLNKYLCAPLPGQHHPQHHQKKPKGAAKIAAPKMVIQVMGHTAVLHLFRPMPAQQVQHGPFPPARAMAVL